MKVIKESDFEESLDKYTFKVVRDMSLCSLFLSILSIFLFVLDIDDYYYFFSLGFYFLALILFFIIERKWNHRRLLLRVSALSSPIWLLLLLLLDDFVLSVKPLLYPYLLFLLLEVIQMGILLKEYINQIFRKQEEYLLVASFENRNKLLGKVSRSLIHDIATPVSILSGTSQLLERRFIDESEYEDLIGNLRIAVNQIEAIIDSTDFLMKKESSYEYFLFNECIDEVVSLMKSRINSAEIIVELNYKTKEMIYGDKNIFLRIFLNIFLNAIEELEKRTREVRKISIKTSQTPKYLCVSVCDNGDGLDLGVLIILNSEDFIISEKNNDMGTGLKFVKYCMKETFGGYLTINYNEMKKENSIKLYFPRI